MSQALRHVVDTIFLYDFPIHITPQSLDNIERCLQLSFQIVKWLAA